MSFVVWWKKALEREKQIILECLLLLLWCIIKWKRPQITTEKNYADVVNSYGGSFLPFIVPLGFSPELRRWSNRVQASLILLQPRMTSRCSETRWLETTTRRSRHGLLNDNKISKRVLINLSRPEPQNGMFNVSNLHLRSKIIGRAIVCKASRNFSHLFMLICLISERDHLLLRRQRLWE